MINFSKLTKIPLVVLCEIIDLYVFNSKTEKFNTAVDFAARGFHIRKCNVITGIAPLSV